MQYSVHSYICMQRRVSTTLLTLHVHFIAPLCLQEHALAPNLTQKVRA